MKTRFSPHAAPGSSAGRRLHAVATLALAAAVALFCRASRADTSVPLSLQVILLSRLETFDRNFRGRAAPVANILVLHRTGDSDSTFEATTLVKALSGLHDIGGLPAKISEAEFSDAESLARRCRADRIAVVYLTVGLEAETPRIASALVNVDVTTVGTSAKLAEAGAVVGFALEETRPKVVLNMKQAAAQHVQFKAEVLELARLVQ
jgi:hypothetical protein